MVGLRAYQQEDVDVLVRRSGMGIFNEQRTGKTPTALCAAMNYPCDKVIIICPKSLIPVWQEEYERWTGQPCHIFNAKKDKEIEVLQENWKHGLVMSYDTFKATKSRAGYVNLVLKCKPDGIILDEAHRIRNQDTAQAKALHKVAYKIDYRLALTGTPAYGINADLWSILHFIQPKVFTSYWQFVKTYFKCDTIWTPHGMSDVPTNIIKPERQQQLTQLLNEYSIMRKRKDVMQWLPKEEPATLIHLELSREQKKYLKQLEEYFEAGHIITSGPLDRIVRYRQICNSPELLGLKGVAPKVDWLGDYLEDYPDRPTIIFSKFRGFLELLNKKYPSIHVLSGAQNLQQRNQLKNDFQSGKITVLAIQTDAGKEGLTLDRAECAIFTDVYPPHADLDQAKDRIVATTADRAAVPKEIVHLIMKDSFDQRLYELVKARSSEADVINNYKLYLKE